MAPTLTLTGGVGTRGDKEIVQRNVAASGAGGAQGIAVSGRLVDIPSERGVIIMARVVADPHGAQIVPWTPLTNQQVNASAGTWSGVLVTGAALPNGVPSGSWYNWEFEAHTAGGVFLVENVGETIRWGVGTLIAWCGQSNQAFNMIRADTSLAAPAQANTGFFSPSGVWVDLPTLDAFDFTDGGITDALWNAGAAQLQKVGEFTSYVHAPGNKTFLWGGGLTPALREIASKVSNDALTLTVSLGAVDIPGIASQPQSNGLVAFLNAVQADAATATGIPAYPVGVVYASVPGSALCPRTQAVPAFGDWGRDGLAYRAARALIRAATGLQNIEAFCFQQGETDGQAPGINLVVLGRDEYYQNLGFLKTAFELDYTGYASEPKLIIATVGQHAPPNTIFGNNNAVFSLTGGVQSDQARFAIDHDLGLASLHHVNLDINTTTLADRGLHWEVDGYEESGAYQAEVVSNKLGFDTAKSSRGPYILKAVFGDEVTPDLGDPNAITLHIQHDKGTDLTLGAANSVNCFEVFDEKGPLAVTAVTAGAAVGAGGVQLLVLTLERDTTQTDAADIPFTAPDTLAGNMALVRYCAWSSIPHRAAPQDNMIFDNAATPMPLAVSFGAEVDDRARMILDKMDEVPIWGGNNIVAAVTSVANLATLRVEIAAPDNWIVNNPDGLGSLQIRPGDRVLFYFLDATVVPNQPYVYRTEAVVRKVNAYTDKTTVVDLLLTHTLNGHPAAQKPIIGDVAVIKNRMQSHGAILAVARSAHGTGH